MLFRLRSLPFRRSCFTSRMLDACEEDLSRAGCVGTSVPAFGLFCLKLLAFVGCWPFPVVEHSTQAAWFSRTRFGQGISSLWSIWKCGDSPSLSQKLRVLVPNVTAQPEQTKKVETASLNKKQKAGKCVTAACGKPVQPGLQNFGSRVSHEAQHLKLARGVSRAAQAQR